MSDSQCLLKYWGDREKPLFLYNWVLHLVTIKTLINRSIFVIIVTVNNGIYICADIRIIRFCKIINNLNKFVSKSLTNCMAIKLVHLFQEPLRTGHMHIINVTPNCITNKVPKLFQHLLNHPLWHIQSSKLPGRLDGIYTKLNGLRYLHIVLMLAWPQVHKSIT